MYNLLDCYFHNVDEFDLLLSGQVKIDVEDWKIVFREISEWQDL